MAPCASNCSERVARKPSRRVLRFGSARALGRLLRHLGGDACTCCIEKGVSEASIQFNQTATAGPARRWSDERRTRPEQAGEVGA